MAQLQATEVQGQLDVTQDAVVSGEVIESTGGAASATINPFRVGQTYSVPGEVVETTGTGSGGGFIPPIFVPVGAETKELVGVRHTLTDGDIDVTLELNDSAIGALNPFNVTTAEQLSSASVAISDGDKLRPTVDTINSGTPRNLTLTLIFESS